MPGLAGRGWLIVALVAAVAALGLMTVSLEKAYAGEYSGTVYFNLSDDGKPVMSDVTGEAMMLVPVSLQDVADVDLADWELEEYAYHEYDGTGEVDLERPTVLKLYLYMLDQYKDDPRNSLAISGDPHSLFMTKFWGHDCNLLYYVNGTYPLFEDGWGATADGIPLDDGDRVDVAMFTDWGFYGDPAAGFNFFAEGNTAPEDGAIVSRYEAEAGVPLSVQVIRGMGNVSYGEDTAYQAAGDLTIHVSEPGGAIDADHESDLTLDQGRIDLTFDEPGEYYIWVDGGEGEYIDNPVQSSVAAKVTVKAAVHVHQMTHHDKAEATCTNEGNIEYWSCSGCNKLFSDEDGGTEIKAEDTKIPVDEDAHNWDDGKVTTPASCTAKGVKTFICQNETSHTKTEDIEMIGHKYGAWKKLNAVQHQKICAHDPAHVVKENHKWDKGKVTRKATPNRAGVKTFTCGTCKATKTAFLPRTADILVAKGITSGATAVDLSWNGIAGAEKYVIYFAKCSDRKGFSKTMTVSGKTRAWKKTGLAKNTCYKFKVVALKKGRTLRTSREIHLVTGNSNKTVTNPKTLVVDRAVFTLGKGRSATIIPKVTKAKAGKRLMTDHAPLYRYTSNDTSVAAVSAKGKITAKKAGTAKIYVQTINGMWRVVTVTVK